MAKQHFLIRLLFCTLIGSTLQSSTIGDNSFFIDEINPDITEIKTTNTLPTTAQQAETEWLVIFYIAADNDLNYFAIRNLQEMMTVGSNKNVTLAVYLDRQGASKNTQLLIVQKNNTYWANEHDITAQQKLNSGSAQTLIRVCDWAISNYPAKHTALILWNHGIGILDSIRGKSTNASELFSFNPTNHMLELNRSIGLFDYLEKVAEDEQDRGVCFSDTYSSYLTNQKLDYALQRIQKKNLKGKKFDIIGFDACLMSMIEVANLIRPYAHYMIGSQEVELGTGWPYHFILSPFIERTLSPQSFAKHIVKSYKKAYLSITKDFTQSAIDLAQVENLENYLNHVCKLLLKALRLQKNRTVVQAIKRSKGRKNCTCFAEPTYIDLEHFLSNLASNINNIILKEQPELLGEIQSAIDQTRNALQMSVVQNETGQNLKKASGLSIYFPSRFINPSYKQTPFAKNNLWIDLLYAILS